MKKTTEVFPAAESSYSERSCHGVHGGWCFKRMIPNGPEADLNIIKFIHEDILMPGSCFGVHEHKRDERQTEEWYVCLEGEGVMILDGEEVPFRPGDVNVCRNGGSHGIVNRSQEPVKFMVIFADAKEL